MAYGTTKSGSPTGSGCPRSDSTVTRTVESQEDHKELRVAEQSPIYAEHLVVVLRITAGHEPVRIQL